MQSRDRSDLLPAHDVFCVAGEEARGEAANTEQAEFTISELAQEFGLTHRALRFYETRGLLCPAREGRQRVFSRVDRERLALILKGKKLGFTLSEISQMIEAQAGRANTHTLALTADRCLEQIDYFERQLREAGAALAELRRIHLALCNQAGKTVDAG